MFWPFPVISALVVELSLDYDESCYFPGFALFFIKCTCFCRPKMKSPDCSREGEVKHQNGTKKVGIWKINCVNFCSYYFLPQETVIPPTSPILNHEDVEENSHEMVIIQSDKSTGNFNFCRLFWFLEDFLTFKAEEFLFLSWKLNHSAIRICFLAKNKTTNGKPVSKLDYDNSEKIIQAEVEICYS